MKIVFLIKVLPCYAKLSRVIKLNLDLNQLRFYAFQHIRQPRKPQSIIHLFMPKLLILNIFLKIHTILLLLQGVLKLFICHPILYQPISFILLFEEMHQLLSLFLIISFHFSL